MWLRVGRVRWTVTRRWLPWRPKTNRIELLPAPVDNVKPTIRAIDVIDAATGLAITTAVFLFNVLVVFLVVIPMFLIEWSLVLVLLPFVVLLRVLRVLPFTVVGRRWNGSSRGPAYRAEVKGWTESLQLLRTVKAEIAANGYPLSVRRDLD